MPKYSLLDNVRIASPCKASWDAMIGNDRIRRCEECRLNVYHLSGMSRNEAEALLANATGRICIRLYRRRDGTVLTQDCPKGLRDKLRRSWRFAVGLAASIGLGALFSSCGEDTSNTKQSRAGLIGKVSARQQDAGVSAQDDEPGVLSGRIGPLMGEPEGHLMGGAPIDPDPNP